MNRKILSKLEDARLEGIKHILAIFGAKIDLEDIIIVSIMGKKNVLYTMEITPPSVYTDCMVSAIKTLYEGYSEVIDRIRVEITEDMTDTFDDILDIFVEMPDMDVFFSLLLKDS